MIRFDNDHLNLALAVRLAVNYLGYLEAPGFPQTYRLEETAEYCNGPYDLHRAGSRYWRLKLRFANWLMAWQHRLNPEMVGLLRQHAADLRFHHGASPAARPQLALLVPYDVSENITGGSARAWGMAQALAREYQVLLLTVAGERKRPEHRWIAPGVELLSFPVGRVLADVIMQAQAATGPAAGLLTVLERAPEIPFLVTYLQQCRQRFSALLLDGPFLFPLVDKLLPGVPLIYNCNDVTTDYVRRLMAGQVSEDALRRLEQVERAVIQRAAGVIMVSEADRSEMCRHYEGLAGKSALVANAMDVASAQVMVPSQAGRLAGEVGLNQRLIVFVGSVLQVNIQAMAFIIEQLAPLFPDELFVLVGIHADSLYARYRRLALPRNVVFTGTVAASVKEAVMALSSVAIAPMADGTGSSLKIPDYLAHGKPVVATAKAMRGYESLVPEVRVAELPDFAAALKDTLNQASNEPARVDAQALRLRHLIQERYDWSVTTRPILNFLAGTAPGTDPHL